MHQATKLWTRCGRCYQTLIFDVATNESSCFTRGPKHRPPDSSEQYQEGGTLSVVLHTAFLSLSPSVHSEQTMSDRSGTPTEQHDSDDEETLPPLYSPSDLTKEDEEFLLRRGASFKELSREKQQPFVQYTMFMLERNGRKLKDKEEWTTVSSDFPCCRVSPKVTCNIL